jgi:hypothetical protein
VLSARPKTATLAITDAIFVRQFSRACVPNCKSHDVNLMLATSSNTIVLADIDLLANLLITPINQAAHRFTLFIEKLSFLLFTPNELGETVSSWSRLFLRFIVHALTNATRLKMQKMQRGKKLVMAERP